MYVGFFSTRNELISAIWNMSTFKQKLRNMPNLLDWRYLYLAFANCIHLNEILCGRHFFSSLLGSVSGCMAPFTLFLTAHATNLRILFVGTNISMDIFFGCLRSVWHVIRNSNAENSFWIIPWCFCLYFFSSGCASLKRAALMQTHTLLIYWNR